MLTALNTKLLLVIAALLASIASYCAYEKHKQVLADRKVQQFLKKPTAQEQKAVDDALTGWANPARDYRSK